MLKKFWNSLNKKNDNTNEEIIEKDDLKAEEENLKNANTDEDINANDMNEDDKEVIEEESIVESVEENIEEMISYLESLDNYTNAYPSYEAHLNDTPDADVKTLAMIIKDNYKVSRLETYDTSIKEIKQVIISLSREDVSTISYLFNYNTESEQFELINLYGNLDSFAAE
jgi:hypothetical protein